MVCDRCNVQIWVMAMRTRNDIVGVCGGLIVLILGFFVHSYIFFAFFPSLLECLGLPAVHLTRFLLLVYFLLLVALLPRELGVIRLLHRHCSLAQKLLLYIFPMGSIIGLVAMMYELTIELSYPRFSPVIAATFTIIASLGWLYFIRDYKSKSKELRLIVMGAAQDRGKHLKPCYHLDKDQW